ncbi:MULTISPECIES: TetR family transcriptional regulator [Streptomyces]|uniref:TetR family transcriptional regulator n=1 Tax=Streptomyces silvae TaxID=2803812 RepID=A0ABU7ZW66_9ACTN|nr:MULTISPECIES: TetR family transcriptional regulator [unclassified Streptomyces]MDX3323894.1 TetR family transcriptional regulator [Streptomyces sp. ME02-6979-3A]MDX3684993.1 TetR family transcriptional regulator [Streptomyces sp. AK04-4c]WSS67482.1 TetR family transcriptional regulator [Streptomyces sp. NBC_01175]WSS74401.1 TetR family transcriptional regulator [Streptomyces sp. NBC_01174]
MTGEAPGRRRDAARSRELLLTAASELFGERGFDRTTIRDIGRRAGVDPTLIARYFGSKTLLYVAALQAEAGDVAFADLYEDERLREVFDRADRRGPVPLLQVAVQPLSEPAAQEAARAALHTRLVEPLRRRFVREGADRPGLRAELVAAAMAGVLLGRHSGAFDELADADPGDLIEVLRGTLLCED